MFYNTKNWGLAGGFLWGGVSCPQDWDGAVYLFLMALNDLADMSGKVLYSHTLRGVLVVLNCQLGWGLLCL